MFANTKSLKHYAKYSQLIPLTILLLSSSITVQASESCTSLFEKGHYKPALKQCSVDAKHNSSKADYILGQLYIKGLGVQQNINKGLAHYRQAVLNNDVDSQIALGQYHAANKQYLQSHIFFSLAIDNGSLKALNLKSHASENLTDHELELSKDFLNLVKVAISQQRNNVVSN